MSNRCLILSSPAIFAGKSCQHVCLPIKRVNLRFSASFSSLSSSSLRRKPYPRSIITFVATKQEQDNALVLEEDQQMTWENETADVSDWEADAVGDAGTGGEEEYSEPPEDAKIFVGNLPYDIDSEKLAQLFEQAGVVEISEVIYNRETDQSRGFGFVTMSTVEAAQKAVDMFHGYELGERILTVNKAAPRGSRPERRPQSSGRSYTMYVGNLPWNIDGERLEQVFSEHGKVVNARIVYDRESGRSRGFGFVSMSSESEMNDAIKNLDGQNVGGREIRVNVAEERRNRDGF